MILIWGILQYMKNDIKIFLFYFFGYNIPHSVEPYLLFFIR